MPAPVPHLPTQEVRWFWEVAQSLPPPRQRRLLAFVTGTDRLPIRGLAALSPPLVVSRWVCGGGVCLVLLLLLLLMLLFEGEVGRGGGACGEGSWSWR